MPRKPAKVLMSKKVVTKKKALADDKSQRARVQHDFARELLKKNIARNIPLLVSSLVLMTEEHAGHFQDMFCFVSN